MDRTASIGRLVNLVVPGGGLILVGSELLGVIVGLLFAATAGFALAATLLIPADVPATWRGLGIGVAIGTYLGAQIRFAQTLRERGAQASAERRRAALRAARSALLEGRVEAAWDSLAPLRDEFESDLVLAYRAAQVLTARGDGSAALVAWRRVRRLDRHRVYRREVLENEQALSSANALCGEDRVSEAQDA